MTTRYRLRTLLIVLAILPPLLAVGWWKYSVWRAEQELLKALREAQQQKQQQQVNGTISTLTGVQLPQPQPKAPAKAGG